MKLVSDDLVASLIVNHLIKFLLMMNGGDQIVLRLVKRLDGLYDVFTFLIFNT